MGRIAQYGPPGVMIRHIPESRRHRMARLRTMALALIATVAASGVVMQEMNDRSRPPGVDIAAGPNPFDLFPG